MVNQQAIDLTVTIFVVVAFFIWVWSISKKQSIQETVSEIKSIITGK